MGKLLDPDYGESTHDLLTSLSQNGLWQKMYGGYYQPLLIDDLGVTSELFYGTWPTWGIMRNGRVTALKPLGRRTKGKEPLSWPTPITQEAKHGSISPAQEGKGLLTNKVIEQERNWPTPRVGDVSGGDRTKWAAEGKWQTGLREAVNLQNWPTPTANEDAAGTPNGKMQKMLGNNPAIRESGKGSLNADWTEILMGLPIGWTDLTKSNEELTPWPGWPAPMNVGENWTTPQANASTQGMEGLLAREKRNGMHATRNLTAQIEISQNGQYPYEPPRVTEGQKNRAKRLKCLGNGCCPEQIYPIFKLIMEAENENRTL